MNETLLSTRPTWWEWTQTALLGVNLIWTSLCLGGFRPETMVVTSALNALLLAVHLASRCFSPADARWPMHLAGWCFLPFLTYGVVNVIGVTPVRWLGWRDWLGWAQMVLVFWVVLNGVRATAPRRVLFGALVGAAFASSVLAVYQHFVKPDWLMMGRIQADQFIGRSSGSFGIPNSLAALLLLVVPALAVLTLRRGAAGVERVLFGYLTLALLIALVLTISRGAWLALALVVAGWPAFCGGTWQRRMKFAALASVAVAVGFLVLYFAMPRVRERFVQLVHNAGEVTRPIMWRGAWQIFREHPAVGGGAGSYNALFEKYRPPRYQDEPVWPHNDYLNTLSDYGLVGFLLSFGVAAALAITLWFSRSMPLSRDTLDESLMASALVAGVVAFALQLLVDFHFKIPALAMAFAVVAALIVQRAWPNSPRLTAAPAMTKVMFSVGAFAVAAASIFWIIPFYRGEALRYTARQSVNRLAAPGAVPAAQRDVLTRALADLRSAVILAPKNAQAWSDLAYATALWAHVDRSRLLELGREAEQSADRALALSEVVPEFWIRRGVALDMQGRRSEAGGAFIRALSLAPANSSVWFYHAYHLSLDKKDRDLALAAANFCLRLDPANAGAQSLRKRLASGRPAP